MKTKRYRIIKICGKYVRNLDIYMKLTIRGNHSENWKRRTSGCCYGCNGIIEVGEPYLHDEDINKCYCQECAVFDPYEEI